MKLLNYLKGDKVIWAIMFLLSLLSILVVYSAVVTLAHKFQQGNAEYYLFKQVVLIGLGFGLTYVFHKIKYTVFSKVAQIGFIISIPLLIYTLLKGVSAGEANRWLEIIPGLGLTFQTSELAKLMLLMYVARVLTIRQGQLEDFKSIFKYLLLPIGIICVLILPANFSTAALLFMNCMFLMFVGRVKLKFMLYIIGSCLVFALFLGVIIYQFPNAIPRGATWKARIENFSKGDSKSNYQSEQAKIAIATGGVIGKGPGNSTQRAFLPQASSDFVYAIIIEEYGLLTGFIMLFLYMILFFRGIRIIKDSDKPFAGFLAAGLTFGLVFQALINMAVAVNLFPVTGQPLPLVGTGGTSIWFTCITIGIILSVSKSNEDKEEENLEELKVILSGGGTGGHIFPAVAIANEIKKINPEAEILFVGALGKMEMEKVPAAGYKIVGLPIAGIQRKVSLSNLKFPFLLIKSLLKARSVVKEFKPNVAIGTGGYASGPCLRAALALGVPALIQEQNSFAGITNKWLSKKASKICVAYEGMEKFFPKEKIILTGNPVRQDISNVSEKRDEAFDFFKLDKNKKAILVVGGSLGAKGINEALGPNLKQLADNDIQLLWQTGKPYFETAKQQTAPFESKNIKAVDFISRMDLAYAMADCVISRAGAGAISELCIVKKPCILVPLPTAAEDHQTQNAMSLVNKNAAILVKDINAKSELVKAAIDLIKNTEKQNELSKNIGAMAFHNSAALIANEVLKLAKY